MSDQIIPRDFPELLLHCWNRDTSSLMDREVAFGIYKREWWSVDQNRLTGDERDLIASLEHEFGEKLLGTKGRHWASR